MEQAGIEKAVKNPFLASFATSQLIPLLSVR